MLYLHDTLDILLDTYTDTENGTLDLIHGGSDEASGDAVHGF